MSREGGDSDIEMNEDCENSDWIEWGLRTFSLKWIRIVNILTELNGDCRHFDSQMNEDYGHFDWNE